MRATTRSTGTLDLHLPIRGDDTSQERPLPGRSRGCGESYTVGSRLYLQRRPKLLERHRPGRRLSPIARRITLSITANNQSTAYGADGDTSLTSGFSITSGELFGSDAVANVVLSTTDGTNSAGYFDATAGSSITPASATGGLSNYAITCSTGTLTVARATLTITANNQNTSYGAASDTSLNAGYTHSTLVGDSIANVRTLDH